MKTLAVGQRFGVYEVLPNNYYASICDDHLQIGSQMVANQSDGIRSGVELNSKYGVCYHFPAESELKKVGTIVITKLK